MIPESVVLDATSDSPESQSNNSITTGWFYHNTTMQLLYEDSRKQKLILNKAYIQAYPRNSTLVAHYSHLQPFYEAVFCHITLKHSHIKVIIQPACLRHSCCCSISVIWCWQMHYSCATCGRNVTTGSHIIFQQLLHVILPFYIFSLLLAVFLTDTL